MARKKRKKLPCVELCNNGRWRYVKWIHRGQPDEIVLRSPAIFESAEEAYGALTEALKLVHQHGARAVAAARPIPTFAELAETWITKVVPTTCKASTARDYESILQRHLLPAFGDRQVDHITRFDIKNLLLGKIKDGYAPSTVTHMKNAISGILALAVDDELLPANPALALGRLWREKPRGQKVNPFSEDELRRLLDTIRADAYWSWYYPLVATLALAGLRAGEACGLQWADIDHDEGLIHVRRSLSRMEVVLPKSGKTRKVDMAASLGRLLREHRTNMKREALARGWGRPPEFVFVTLKGRPVDINPFRRHVWNPAQDKAGVPRRRIHDLRHTYATLRISRGDNPADVSAQLGHHSVQFTLDQYYHWLRNDKARAEVDNLAASLGVGV